MLSRPYLSITKYLQSRKRFFSSKCQILQNNEPAGTLTAHARLRGIITPSGKLPCISTVTSGHRRGKSWLARVYFIGLFLRLNTSLHLCYKSTWLLSSTRDRFLPNCIFLATIIESFYTFLRTISREIRRSFLLRLFRAYFTLSANNSSTQRPRRSRGLRSLQINQTVTIDKQRLITHFYHAWEERWELTEEEMRREEISASSENTAFNINNIRARKFINVKISLARDFLKYLFLSTADRFAGG